MCNNSQFSNLALNCSVIFIARGIIGLKDVIGMTLNGMYDTMCH